MKKLLFIALSTLSMSAMADTINLNAQAPGYQYCIRNQLCGVRGTNDIQIINDSNEDHYYRYSYKICIDGDTCRGPDNNVTVKAHTTFYNHLDGYVNVRLSYGNHQLHNYTYVDGLGSRKETQGIGLVIAN